MERERGTAGPCVCGFGGEYFTMDGGKQVCSVCGGLAGKGVLAPSPPITTPPEPAAGKTILVVDDQNFFRERIKGVLTAHKHHVLEAADGFEAIKMIGDVYFRRSKVPQSRIDAILLDLILPGELDGFHVLGAVKALLPEMPILILTASPPKKDLLQKLAKLGAKKYLNKSAADLDTLVARNIEEA